MDAREDDGAALTVYLASSSTSSCSCRDCGGGEEEANVFVEQRRATEEKEESGREKRGGGRETGRGDDGNGYLTPTSSERIIWPIKECPPAPKKTPRFLNLKRKRRVRGGRSGSTVKPARILDLDLEQGEFLQENKKARREASMAE